MGSLIALVLRPALRGPAAHAQEVVIQSISDCSASLVAPGGFQFSVVAPASLADGDQPITATYNGLSTQTGMLITVHQ